MAIYFRISQGVQEFIDNCFSLSFLENLTEIATICTESGIWQPISFNCVFDPLAINLKKSGSIGGMYMSH